MKKTLAVLPLMLVLLVGRGDAQSLESLKSQAELDKTIASVDAALFDAYNRCDLVKFSSFFPDDVEFYHDQGGVTLGNAKLTESIQKNICGGDVRRELVAGTLQVHLMKGYGAVEIGYTGSIILSRRPPPERGSSFTSGNTKTGRGRLRGRLVTIITRRGSRLAGQALPPNAT